MAGNKQGALKARDTNIRKYGEDFYRKIGSSGGKNGYGKMYGGGFADGEAGRERARIWGAVGGKISKRRARK